MKSFFMLFFFLGSNFVSAEVLHRAVIDQDATNPQLISDLKSSEIKKQKRALVTLAKIPTNTALALLVGVRPQILTSNYRQYCLALGQMHLISEVSTGINLDVTLRDKALEIVSTIIESVNKVLQNQSKNKMSQNAIQNSVASAHCFEAFAKLSPRDRDAQMETLFKSLVLNDDTFWLALVSLYYHRVVTFDAKNPTDRYWFSPELKGYLRGLNLQNHKNPLVQQSWSRVAYLSNDEQVFDDYKKIVDVSTDVVAKVIGLELINMFNKTDFNPTKSALGSSNHQVVYAALANATRLKMADVLYTDHLTLLSHPQKQVRRALLEAIKEKVQLDDIRPLLSDKSIGVRQLAAAIFVKLNASEKFEFSQKVLAGDDRGLKKGVIDASAEFGDQRTEILKMALYEQDQLISNYVLTHIQEKKVESLYALALGYLTSLHPDQRIEATKILLNSSGLEKRLELILETFKRSQDLLYEYTRSEIIKFLLASKDQDEKALLPELLKVETNWRFANMIGSQIPNYNMRAPEFKTVSNDAFPVEKSRVLIKMKTTQGDMVFELFYDKAPLHVAHFLANVDQGLMNNNYFHRVVDNFVAQASRPFSENRLENSLLPAEILGLRQSRGTLAMPRNDYLHSGKAENFYINLITNFSLNYNYTVFGRLVVGDSVLDQLEIGDRVLNVSRIQ